MKIRNKNSSIVYSTESGRLCPECNEPALKCVCQQQQATPATDGIVSLVRETKGRKGKGVTLITGVPLNTEGLKNLAKVLKQKCGSGGSIKAGVIEIQGDHQDMLEQELVGLGYKMKRMGG